MAIKNSEFDPTLAEAQAINARFDAENDNAATRYQDAELHVGFHILNAANKLLYGVKETSDHPGEHLDDKVIDEEVIPDLLKFALQLAQIRGKDISELFLHRLQSLEARNKTTGSLSRALNTQEIQ